MSRKKNDAKKISVVKALLHALSRDKLFPHYNKHPIAVLSGAVLGLVGSLITFGTLLGLIASYFFSKEPTPPPKSTQEQSTSQIRNPNADLAKLARVRMFWGTLSPNGEPAVISAVINTSPNGIENVATSTWIIQGTTASRLDERQIGYIGQGEFREEQTILSFTPHGRGLLCISGTYDGRNMSALHFFESVGEYAKYGPMTEMRRFREPISADGSICQTLPSNVAALTGQK